MFCDDAGKFGNNRAREPGSNDRESSNFVRDDRVRVVKGDAGVFKVDDARVFNRVLGNGAKVTHDAAMIFHDDVDIFVVVFGLAAFLATPKSFSVSCLELLHFCVESSIGLGRN